MTEVSQRLSTRDFYLSRLKGILSGSLKADDFTSSAHRLFKRRATDNQKKIERLPILGTISVIGIIVGLCSVCALTGYDPTFAERMVAIAFLILAVVAWGYDVFTCISFSAPKDEQLVGLVAELEILRSSISRYLSKLDSFTTTNFAVMTQSKVSSHYALIELQTALQHKIDAALIALKSKDPMALDLAESALKGSIVVRSQFAARSGDAHLVPLERASAVATLIINDLESNIAETAGIELR